MTNSSWIEPPPPQRGLGCFAKGCLILVVFFILLGIAFIGGTYFAVRYLRSEYFPTAHVKLPVRATTEEQEAEVKARWDDFERAARAHKPARIELTADDLNALIASEPKLRGNAFVSIENNVARLQLSFPFGEWRWLKGHYLNAECAVQSASDGDPSGARITAIVINGRPVSDDVLTWQFGPRSLRRSILDWSNEKNLQTFQIADDKVILETKGIEERE